MSRIIIQGSTVVISSETGFLHHSIGAADFKLINPSEKAAKISTNEEEKQKLPDTTNANSRGKTVDKDVKINFVCSALSSDNKLLAFQTLDKVLLVYEVNEWKLIFHRQLGRGASKITFTPECKNILVGDKTGDVLLYELYSNKKESPLLGHLSIILDIVMTDDSKYIITCDRDEKIRVSNYPNCYNIENYCLGHEKFVTNIQLLPHNCKMLISCSGDGTLRLWDYVQGSIIDVYKFNINKAGSDSVNNDSQNQLKCFTSVQLNDTSSIVCVSIFKSSIVYILQVRNESFEMINSLNLVHEPVHLQLCYNTPECKTSKEIHHDSKEINLWLVGLDKLLVYTWNFGNLSFEPTTSSSLLHTLNILNMNFKKLAVDSNNEHVIYVLQKRKMDEITDYFTRKQARIDKKKCQEK